MKKQSNFKLQINNELKKNPLGALSIKSFVEYLKNEESRKIILSHLPINCEEIDEFENSIPNFGVLSIDISNIMDFINNNEQEYIDFSDYYSKMMIEIKNNPNLSDSINKVILACLYKKNIFDYEFERQDLLEIIMMSLLFHNLNIFFKINDLDLKNNEYKNQLVEIKTAINHLVIENMMEYASNMEIDFLLSTELDRGGEELKNKVVGGLQKQPMGLFNKIKLFKRNKNEIISNKHELIKIINKKLNEI